MSMPAGPVGPDPVLRPSYSGVDDPLVPVASDFGSWWAKVQEVARRSWRSALMTTGLGIAVPLSIATLIRYTVGFAPSPNFLQMSAYVDTVTTVAFGVLITLVAYIAVAFVASAGWAAGTWALVQEATTGRPADVRSAFRYGFRRAASLWPWAIVAGAAYYVGGACFPVGLYVAFALSMFGFAGIFERGDNPLLRSLRLTHADFGPSLGKILLCFVPFFVISLVTGVVFGALMVVMAFADLGGFAYDLTTGVLQAIVGLIQVIGLSALLVGLLPTYAQLRRLETPVTTAQLNQDMGR